MKFLYENLKKVSSSKFSVSWNWKLFIFIKHPNIKKKMMWSCEDDLFSFAGDIPCLRAQVKRPIPPSWPNSWNIKPRTWRHTSIRSTRNTERTRVRTRPGYSSGSTGRNWYVTVRKYIIWGVINLYNKYWWTCTVNYSHNSFWMNYVRVLIYWKEWYVLCVRVCFSVKFNLKC